MCSQSGKPRGCGIMDHQHAHKDLSKLALIAFLSLIFFLSHSQPLTFTPGADFCSSQNVLPASEPLLVITLPETLSLPGHFHRRTFPRTPERIATLIQICTVFSFMSHALCCYNYLCVSIFHTTLNPQKVGSSFISFLQYQVRNLPGSLMNE